MYWSTAAIASLPASLVLVVLTQSLWPFALAIALGFVRWIAGWRRLDLFLTVDHVSGKYVWITGASPAMLAHLPAAEATVNVGTGL